MKTKQTVHLWRIIALAVVIECVMAGCTSKPVTQTEKKPDAPSASASSGNVAQPAKPTTATQTANAQQYDPESDFTVTKLDNGKSIAITKYKGSKQIVSIPPSIQGFPVTTIGYEAFKNNKNLTSVAIPNIRKTARFT